MNKQCVVVCVLCCYAFRLSYEQIVILFARTNIKKIKKVNGFAIETTRADIQSNRWNTLDVSGLRCDDVRACEQLRLQTDSLNMCFVRGCFDQCNISNRRPDQLINQLISTHKLPGIMINLTIYLFSSNYSCEFLVEQKFPRVRPLIWRWKKK